MRKILAGTILIIIFFIIAIYLFVPSRLTVSEVGYANCTVNGAFRALSNEKKWKSWWPENAHRGDTVFDYKGNSYDVTDILKNTAHINIMHRNDSIRSTLLLVPLPGDSVAIQWKCNIRTGANPVHRIQRYMQAHALKSEMNEIVDTLTAFLQQTQNIYGINIQSATTYDTLLVGIKSDFNAYPSTKDIYTMIHALQEHVASRNATQRGYPMLNVTQVDSTHYRAMTALPVDKKLEDEGPFLFRRMVPGKFLTAEVKGGTNTIRSAWQKMQQYLQDYREVTMAMPFEYLVTDRLAEADTAKWITRLFVPVYYTATLENK